MLLCDDADVIVKSITLFLCVGCWLLWMMSGAAPMKLDRWMPALSLLGHPHYVCLALKSPAMRRCSLKRCCEATKSKNSWKQSASAFGDR